MKKKIYESGVNIIETGLKIHTDVVNHENSRKYSGLTYPVNFKFFQET